MGSKVQLLRGLLELFGRAGKRSNSHSETFSHQEVFAAGHNDPEQLLYEYSASRDDDKVVIKTEEYDINAFIKILLDGRAKVEVYSAHNHDGPYGRRRS
jgi:hypothetical protein